MSETSLSVWYDREGCEWVLSLDRIDDRGDAEVTQTLSTWATLAAAIVAGEDEAKRTGLDLACEREEGR